MLNKILLTLTAAGIMTLSAAGATYKISLLDDSVVAGKQIKAGDYKVELKDNNTAVLMHGKKSIEVPAKTETSPTKFATTEIQYQNNNQLQEIRVGGTNTKIVFGGSDTSASGME
jgi:hypothetical protein